MKFYNPFKPHIVELNTGKFAVRQLGSHGWGYLESHMPHDYWWCSLEFRHHFEVSTIERAKELLVEANLQLKPPEKTKVVKVHL